MFHNYSMSKGEPTGRLSRSTVFVDETSVTPARLIASKNLQTDPRLSRKGFNDSIDVLLPPSGFDPVAISRYARYCRGVVDQMRASHAPKPEPKPEPKPDSKPDADIK